MRNAGLDEAQAGINISGRSINNFRYADDNILMANRWAKVGTVTDFIFLGSKITGDSDCSHEIKRHLLPGRKAMTNLDSILSK